MIFVSIDDNEVHHLRCLMDEVFGEENVFATLSRRAMHTVRNSSKDFNLNADFILAYARHRSGLQHTRIVISDSRSTRAKDTHTMTMTAADGTSSTQFTLGTITHPILMNSRMV